MKMLSSILSCGLVAFILMSGKPVNKPVQAHLKSSISHSPSAASFSFIRAHRQGKGVTVTWAAVVQGGANFMIEKTYSDPFDPWSVWEQVGGMPYNGARSYKFTDDQVYPGYINYRITAFNNDGTVDHSGIVTVRIVSRK